ncbi:N-acetylmuramoyl-L-alanine amidase [Hydrogenimonas sp.]
MRLLLLPLLVALSLSALEIVDRPILFGPERITLTQQYIKRHYGYDARSIEITPKIVVIHYTAIPTLEGSFRAFYPETLPGGRADIQRASRLNVSAHFLVDRDGTVYRLMKENRMARHVIGLNHCAVGIENVGGGSGEENLTQEQLRANVELVRYLVKKYPTIGYLIGHYEYRRFETSSLWLERDAGYRTVKKDPGERFMRALRRHFPGLKSAP